jgi:hypothetical protein
MDKVELVIRQKMAYAYGYMCGLRMTNPNHVEPSEKPINDAFRLGHKDGYADQNRLHRDTVESRWTEVQKEWQIYDQELADYRKANKTPDNTLRS